MATDKEIKADSIAKMGEQLGSLYHALLQTLIHLYGNWNEYVELFGTKPSRIDTMNSAAPSFFGMLQNELWNAALLHMARLTDPPKSAGRLNLSIRALPDLIADDALRAEVMTRIDVALDATKFCRDWRNRYLAHSDLHLALNVSGIALTEASRAHVNDGLAALASVLNTLDKHFNSSETYFHLQSGIGGAVELLYILDEGIRARDQRMKRIEEGDYTVDDIELRDI